MEQIERKTRWVSHELIRNGHVITKPWEKRGLSRLNSCDACHEIFVVTGFYRAAGLSLSNPSNMDEYCRVTRAPMSPPGPVRKVHGLRHFGERR